MTQTAKLFKNGRSQAVRLPKEFRFEGTEVAIRRDPLTGAVLLLEPSAPSTPRELLARERLEGFDQAGFPEDSTANRRAHIPRSSWEECFAVWDSLGSPNDDVLERDQTPPVERDFF